MDGFSLCKMNEGAKWNASITLISLDDHWLVPGIQAIFLLRGNIWIS
mgnify:CR=1 FL=1